MSHPLTSPALILQRQAAVTQLRGGLSASASPSLSALPPGTYPGSKRGGGALGAASRGAGAAQGLEGGGAGGSAQWVGLLQSVLKAAAAAGDLERGLMRIFHRTATPIEVWNWDSDPLSSFGFLAAAACSLFVNASLGLWPEVALPVQASASRLGGKPWRRGGRYIALCCPMLQLLGAVPLSWHCHCSCLCLCLCLCDCTSHCHCRCDSHGLTVAVWCSSCALSVPCTLQPAS